MADAKALLNSFKNRGTRSLYLGKHVSRFNHSRKNNAHPHHFNMGMENLKKTGFVVILFKSINYIYLF